MNSERAGEAVREHERLPRKARIRKGSDIRALLREGRRIRTPHLEIFVGTESEPRPRFGTIVPKYRHSVVERNRVRRRLREIGRTCVLPALRRAGAGHGLLVRARPSAYGASYHTLEAELVRATEELCSEAS